MSNRAQSQLANRLFPAAIILAPLLLFWRWLFYGEVLYWGTLLLQFWPWRHLVKISLLAGRWPLWNDLLGNGTPLLANLQSAVFYPPNLLLLALPVEHMLTAQMVLHLILAGLLMMAYARHLRLNSFAGAVAGLSYMLSGYLIGRSQFPPMVATAAWFPLLLLLADRLASQRTVKNAVWLALALAVQLLAGHAQLWFYGLLLIFPYLVFRSRQASQLTGTSLREAAGGVSASPVKPVGHAVLLALAAVLLALLLAAAQLLPTAEFLSQSPRSNGPQQTAALTYSYWPWRLVTLLAPDFFGNPAQGNYWGYANYWEDHAYVGVLPLLLALFAVGHVLKHRKNIFGDAATPAALRTVPFFAVVVPVSLILAMGWNTPVYLWVYKFLPGFALFRAPARLLIWFTVAMSLLAGVGAHVFTVTPRSRGWWRRLLAVCVAVAVAGIIGGFYLSGRNITFVMATRSAGIWLALAVVVLLLRPAGPSSGKLTERSWQWLALAFIGVDLLLAGRPLLPTLPPDVFRTPIQTAETIKTATAQPRYFSDSGLAYHLTFDRYFRFDDYGPNQLDHWQAFKETLTPNFGVAANLPSANNNDPLVISHWQQLMTRLEHAAPPERDRILAVMGVTHRIGPPGEAGQLAQASGKDFGIYPLPNAAPRAWFVPQAILAQTPAAALDTLTSPDFDSRREVIIMGSGPKLAGPAPAKSDEPANVTLTEAHSGRVEIAVDAPTAGFVVLSDTAYPGWQAQLDGQPAQILPANVAFRAVAVTPGQHRLLFTYRPASFTAGLWISGATIGALLLAGGVTGLRRSRRYSF